MKFDLTHPCGNCPFRTDLASGPYINANHMREIIGDPKARGKASFPACSFPCHKTIDYDVPDGERPRIPSTAQQCAGAMIVLARSNVPNDAMQLAERLLGWNPGALDMTAPVYFDRRECIAAHEAADGT